MQEVQKMKKAKVNVIELSQLDFKVKQMVVWRDYIIVLSEIGKLYAIELSP